MTKWLDNAFWHDNSKTVVKAILETDLGGGKVDRNVHTITKTADDGTENVLWAQFFEQVSAEKVDKNTNERNARKAKEHALETQRREEVLRAKQLEALFDAKLKAFEIQDIKDCKNRQLKARLRKAKNMVEVNAFATIIIMEQINNESKEQ